MLVLFHHSAFEKYASSVLNLKKLISIISKYK